MNQKAYPDDYFKELEEDMSSFNYSKKQSKFIVRENKLKKRRDKYEEWYD